MSENLFEDLFVAYYDARRNKRNTANQLKFELRLEENLLNLYHQLEDRTYKVGRSVAFIIEEPVKREVFAAGFADRVVHHLYFNYVNEIFERTFIEDSYSCRKGKGTSRGIDRLDHHIRSCSANYTKDAYVLKLDLSGYFMSINRQILYDKVVGTLNKYAERKNREGVRFCDALDYDLLMYLTREIVFHDPIENCFIRGDMSEWEGLPPDKSLFHSTEGCGLPIGNLTSQLFSNVYLNDFDQYVKRTLKMKHYGRYVDDFYMVSPSVKLLNEKKEQIKTYMEKEMGLKLHPRKIYLQHVRRGVSFLGAIIKPHRRYTMRRTVANFKNALAKGCEYYKEHPQKLMQTMNSYLGFILHAKSFKLRKRVVEKNRWTFKFGWINVRYAKFIHDDGVGRYEQDTPPGEE
ncbi:MAG: RNA-directed DNA polymerase [Rikenellaceae bacterium]|jgi:retron-type reverse transcriptase|nr:RNA-directed DNA polymerase [Rikenellaceae bacterium]